MIHFQLIVRYLFHEYHKSVESIIFYTEDSLSFPFEESQGMTILFFGTIHITCSYKSTISICFLRYSFDCDAFSTIFFRESSNGGLATPDSVMIPVIYFASVTSNAG